MIVFYIQMFKIMINLLVNNLEQRYEIMFGCPLSNLLKNKLACSVNNLFKQILYNQVKGLHYNQDIQLIFGISNTDISNIIDISM